MLQSASRPGKVTVDGWLLWEFWDQIPSDVPNHARPEMVKVNPDSDDDGKNVSDCVCVASGGDWALTWSSPDTAILLRSSATRSSLFTILLLLPVFFLRSSSRPGP